MGVKKVELGFFFSGTQQQDKGQWTQTGMWEVPNETSLFQEMTEHWNSLPREAVDSPYLEKLTSVLSYVIGCWKSALAVC